MSFYDEVLQKDARFRSLVKLDDMALLEPVTRAAVQAILTEADAMGLPCDAFETFRSAQRQTFLFQTGKSKLSKVGVHHYGLACDIVRVVNGRLDWSVDYSFLRDLAKKHGLIWGGDWGDPGAHHSFIDADHVQRCSLARQVSLFNGDWYPDAGYNPTITATIILPRM